MRVQARWFVLVAVVVAPGVQWLALQLRSRLDPVVVSAAVGVFALVLWLALRSLHPVGRAWHRDPPGRVRLKNDRRLSAMSWAVHGVRDERSWELTLAPVLVEAVRTHLTGRGIDPDTEPDRALAELPPELRPLLQNPAGIPRTRASLDALIRRIEDL